MMGWASGVRPARRSTRCPAASSETLRPACANCAFSQLRLWKNRSENARRAQGRSGWVIFERSSTRDHRRAAFKGGMFSWLMIASSGFARANELAAAFGVGDGGAVPGLHAAHLGCGDFHLEFPAFERAPGYGREAGRGTEPVGFGFQDGNVRVGAHAQ